MKSADLHKEGLEALEIAEEADHDNRKAASDDLSFLAGWQWPDSVRQERQAAGRPMLTLNRLPHFVRAVTNEIRQATPTVKVVPVGEGASDEMAELYNGLIREIQYQSNARSVYACAAEHQVMCGMGHFRVATRYTDDASFDQEIVIEGIPNPLSVYWDPNSFRPDRSDAMWVFVTVLKSKAAFKAEFPDADDTSIDMSSESAGSSVWWGTDEHVRVAEWWRKVPVRRTLAQIADGSTIDVTDMARETISLLGVTRTRDVLTHRVEQHLLSGTEMLGPPSPWPGKHLPIISVVGSEIPLEKGVYRHGLVRYAKDPQQLYNYWRTMAAETIALAPKAPWLATPDMIGPYKGQWDQANRSTLPYLLYRPDPTAPGARPERVMPPPVPSALVQEGALAAEDLKATTGLFDASLGARSNETSGVAIQARQREGDTATYHYGDNLEASLTHCGRVLVDLIPRVYDSDRVIRVRGQQDERASVRINQAVIAHDGEPLLVHDVSVGRYDVHVTVGPSYATKRIDAANSMLEFVKIMPQAAPVLGDLIAKAMEWPGSEDIADRLRRMIPPNLLADAPPMDPMADPMAQAAQQLARAEADEKRAMADRAMAQNAAMGIPPQPPTGGQQPPLPPGLDGQMSDPGMPGIEPDFAGPQTAPEEMLYNG